SAANLLLLDRLVMCANPYHQSTKTIRLHKWKNLKPSKALLDTPQPIILRHPATEHHNHYNLRSESSAEYRYFRSYTTCRALPNLRIFSASMVLNSSCATA